MPDASPAAAASLAALRGLRTAPALTPEQRSALRRELAERLAGCRWFTVGVMAPTAPAAVTALRALEGALDWPPLELDPGCALPETLGGGAFLKGNQRSGRFLVRPEAGLGEGILITGHHPDDPAAEDTWGPLPLDLFAP
ncbi:MAG: DUF1824 family protein [Synechococcaceae cyanobacterium]|nr:DUF1824 family protein [Synechococcaceae cyanobacterium]